MKNSLLKKLIAVILLITLVFGQLVSGVAETMTEEEQEAYNADIAEAEKRMAQNIYVYPDLSQTSGEFTTYTVDFYGSLTPLYTYWSLSNFYMEMTDETKEVYPGIRRTGGAYTGLQHTTQDTKVGILSFWEHYYNDENGDRAILRATRIYPEGNNNFGGEGEGTNCIKQYDWEGEHWYRLVLHCWEDVENETTFCGMWLCDLETGKWTLFSYFDTHFVNSYITGGMSMFQENYHEGISNWMNEREFHVKNIYAKDAQDGEWYSLYRAQLRYGDNWGNKMGGASIGTGEDEDGEYFFGRAGGLVEGQYPGNYVAAQDAYEENLPYSEWFSIEQPEQPTLATPEIEDVTVDITEGVCSVGWSMSETSSPELLYEVDVTDADGNSLYSYKASRPEEYSVEFDAVDEEFYTVNIKITDIYGQTDTMSVTIEPEIKVIAPEAVTDLVYSGEEQELVVEGSVCQGSKEAGFVIYALEDGAWSSEIPVGIDAKEYTVNYIAIDSTGNVLESGSVVTTIEKAKQSVPQNLVFNNESVYGKGDGTITGLTTDMEYSLDNGTTWIDVTDPNMEFSVGPVRVRNAETDNYYASGVVVGSIGNGSYLVVDDSDVMNAIIYSEDSFSSVEYGGEVSFTIEPFQGYSYTDEFMVLANGEEIIADENSVYTISNIKTNVYLQVYGIEDTNPPVISGIENGGVYYTTQLITVEDDNLISVILNGTYCSTSITIDGNVAKMYTIVACDEAGNLVEYKFSTMLISTLAEPLESVSDTNSYEENLLIIDGVLESIEAIDLTYATDDEKQEIQEIIDRCNELLEDIKGTTATFEIRHSLNLLDLVQIGYWFTATPDNDGVEFVDYGLLVWDEESYLAETDFTVTSENAYQPELSFRSGYQMAYGEGVYAQYLDTKYYAIPYAVTADGEYVYAETPDVYAIPMYAREQGFINSTDENLKTVVYDLLNYATFAQYYFYERNTDIDVNKLTPINSVLSVRNQTSRFDESMLVEDHTVDNDTAGGLDCTWLYTTANLESAIALNFFAEQSDEFTGMLYWNASDYSKAASLVAGTETAKISVVDRILYDSSTTTGQIDSIYAKDLATPQYACMYSEVDGEYTYGAIRVDSIAAYITRGINATNENSSDENYYFVEMCRRMLAYGDSAKTYAETR